MMDTQPDAAYRRQLHADAVRQLGTRYKLAQFLGLSTQRVYAFGGLIPVCHVDRIQKLLERPTSHDRPKASGQGG